GLAAEPAHRPLRLRLERRGSGRGVGAGRARSGDGLRERAGPAEAADAEQRGAAEESAPIEVGGRAALRRCLPGGLPGPFFVVVVHFRSSPKRRSDAAAVTIANGGRGAVRGCSKRRSLRV